MENVTLLFVALAGLVALAALAKILLNKRGDFGKLPYRRSDYLLTNAERSFFEVLRRAVGDSMYIFVKVRLADLLWLPQGTKDRQAHLNRVLAKHIDFILCDREAISPVLAIELDDSSHNMSDRKERDAFVNEALRSAGLPLLRVPAKRSYALQELTDLISREIDGVRAKRGHGKR